MRKIFHIILLLVTINTYSQKVFINQTFTSTETIDLANKNIGNIYTAALGAQITLNGKNSLARILFVDEYDNEILATELFYPLYLPGNYDVYNIEELSKIKGVSLRDLKIVLVDASIQLNYIQFFPDSASSSGFNIPSENTVIQNKINQLNVNLSDLGYLWRANINEDNYYYSDRNQMPTDDLLSYGFGYYDKGIFAAYPPTFYENKTYASTNVPEFDWRKRHGATVENSPYFDANFDTYWTSSGTVTCDEGNGWMTKIHCQRGNYGAPWGRCPNGCYLFSVTNSVEAKMNLYYNQHLDYDLSEQEIMECSPYSSSTCYYGGDPEKTAKYIRDFGVVNESCLPYINDTCSCSIKCTSPESKVKIEEYQS